MGVTQDEEPGILHPSLGVEELFTPGEGVQVRGVAAVQFQQRLEVALREGVQQNLVRVRLPPSGGLCEHGDSLPDAL